ncbi:MAG: S8 family serine peptidase, partial [Rhizomicrobium sp.]
MTTSAPDGPVQPRSNAQIRGILGLLHDAQPCPSDRRAEGRRWICARVGGAHRRYTNFINTRGAGQHWELSRACAKGRLIRCIPQHPDRANRVGSTCRKGKNIMYRTLLGGALSAIAVLGFAAGASAQQVQREGSVFYKDVCPPVQGETPRCHSRVITDSQGNPLVSATPPVGGLTPADLRSAYKIKANGQASTIIALVDAYGYDQAESDLGVYRAEFGLPACTTDNGCFKKLNQKGQEKKYPPPNTGWDLEQALDLAMASAMCPDCTIYLVEGTTNSFKDLGTAVDTAATLGAHVISNSYGATEGKYAKKIAGYYDHPGVAVLASAGDSGYGVQYPADVPSVIAVGGTYLTTAQN